MKIRLRFESGAYCVFLIRRKQHRLEVWEAEGMGKNKDWIYSEYDRARRKYLWRVWIIILRGVCKGFYVWRRGDYPVLLFSFRYIGKGSFVERDVRYCLLKRYYSFIGNVFFVYRNIPFCLY